MPDASDSGPEVTEPVLAEFHELSAGLDPAVEWNAVVAAFGDYVAEGPDLDPWAELAARIERHVADQRPASFIRLGDGEGSVLALGLDEHPDLTAYCARRTSLRHLGSADALERAAPEMLPAFHAALRLADVIGFPGPFAAGMMLKRGDTATYLRPVQGLVSVHRYLTRFAADLGLEAKIGAPAGFHRGLLPHYRDLLAGQEIGIVTCHPELAEALRARMGAAEVDLRPVPRQAVITLDPHHDTGHWPGRYRELCRELQAIEPGRLWLVAAGMLGKVYCDVIRAAGGIAVDIGHVADVWVGIASRFYDQADVLARWRLV